MSDPITWKGVKDFLKQAQPMKFTNAELAELFHCERYRMSSLTLLMWEAREITRINNTGSKFDRVFYTHKRSDDEQVQSN